MTVLGFNAGFGPFWVPGNGGNTIVKPAACVTGTHVAGTGETAVIDMVTAVIDMVTTAIPNPAATDTIYLDAMYSVDGGAPQVVEALGLSAESTSDGIANVSTVARLPLQAGHTYQFRAGVSSNGGVQLPNNGGFCQATVEIVRAAG